MGIAYVSDPIFFALESIQCLSPTRIIQPDNIVVASRDEKVVRSMKRYRVNTSILLVIFRLHMSQNIQNLEFIIFFSNTSEVESGSVFHTLNSAPIWKFCNKLSSICISQRGIAFNISIKAKKYISRYQCCH